MPIWGNDWIKTKTETRQFADVGEWLEKKNTHHNLTKTQNHRDTNDIVLEEQFYDKEDEANDELEEEFYGITAEEDDDGVVTTKEDPLQRDLYF